MRTTRFVLLALALLLFGLPAVTRAQEEGQMKDEMQKEEMNKAEGEMKHDEMKKAEGEMKHDEMKKAEGEMKHEGEMAHDGMKKDEIAMAKLPLVVKIHADWCPKCQAISKTWSRIESELSDEARVVVLDVTDDTTLKAAQAKAKELGLEKFFEKNRSRTGSVAIFKPGATSPEKVLVAEKDFGKYEQVLDEISAG